MAKKMLAEHYNEAFYDRQVAGSVSSAEVILGLLYDFYQPRSVIDVGCGRGAWLSVAESLGAKILIGLDGYWNTKDKLLCRNIDFTSVDLEGPVDIREKYDLCISLEVAEHLASKRAKAFVEILCKSSNVILFSAAIINQGGENHINEQWQSYWIELFQANGYECFDIFREMI
jgi:cyclopropane fatty-acyl-phospholipid synthase-like methyltransferase